MGRNGALPKRFFGYVHPRRHTPLFAVLFAGAVCLLAIGPSLELVSSVVSFGALVAFSFVNLSVIAHFAIRHGRRRNLADVLRFIIAPLLGASGTGLLWMHLSGDAMIAGLVWTTLGVAYLVILTRGFRRPVAELGIDDSEELEAVPARH
jgi:putrescine importer